MEYSCRFRLYPDARQEELIHNNFNCCRYVYNYFLAERQKVYNESGRTMSFFDCCKALTELKNEQPWLKVADSQALIASLKDLDQAFNNFFRNPKLYRYPQFHKKKSYRQSYRARKNIVLSKNHIRLPKIGEVRCAVSKQVDGRILSATVSQSPSGKYFVSVVWTDVELELLPPTGNSIGINLGVKNLLALSDGNTIESKQFYCKKEKQLAKLMRKLSRKTKDGKNYHKLRIRIARLSEQIANQRSDTVQKLTTELIRKYDVICIKKIESSKLMRMKQFSKLLADASWSEIQRELRYKAGWYGKKVIFVDQYYPSSQFCSECGAKSTRPITRKKAEWICPTCGVTHNREINSAKNILKEGLRISVGA